jgi:glycosyltransferase involved in cell wall biosynthesis
MSSVETVTDYNRVALKVAVLTHVLTPHRAPLIQNVARQFTGLRVFVSSPWDEPHKFSLAKSDMDVVVQKSINWAHRFRNAHGYPDVSYINLPYDTWNQLERFSPDVIISTECGVRSILSTLYRIAHPEVTLIVWAHVTEHTEATRGRLRQSVRRWILKHTDAVFVNGRSGDSYIRSLGFEGLTFSVPYTIDSSLFERERYEPDPHVRRLLFTGQLIKRKGLGVFCRILSRWCEQHPARRIFFRMVGDGPERAEIEAIRTPANLTLEIFGGISQDGLAPHYDQADIYAFPSLGDEWGVVVNEAMIAGLPVLGSTCSGAIDELVVEGETGWLFSPYDEEEIYQALERSLNAGTETLVAMSDRAKATIAQIAPPRVATTVVRAIARTSKAFDPMSCPLLVTEGEEVTL